MISLRPVTYTFGLILVILYLVGCNGSTPTPTPDLVATEVAVQKTAAAILTAEAAATQQAAASTPTVAPTEPGPIIAPPTHTSTLSTPDNGVAQPTPTNSPEVSAKPVCTVVPASLNLRSGPGVAYEPPLATIVQGTVLKPIGFSAIGYPGGQWVQVQTPDNLTGWVITDPQFVTCNVDPATLPPVSAPPPPMPTSTPTLAPAQPTPTPSPTPELFVVLEPPGGGNDNIDGYVVFPGYTQGQLNPNDVVFRNRMVFRVIAYDIRRMGLKDGAGIENVRFEITNSQGSVVYEHTEQTAGYCVFGGGEPNCNVWNFAEHNYRWPEPYSDQRIENDDYTVQITIQPQNGDAANWNFDFRIEGAPANEPSNLTAEVVQTGPGTTSNEVSDALVFQVFASTDGVNDGVGVDRVDMRIIGDNGEIYQRTEQTAAYCAFSGGEPDCNMWNFAQHNNRWPNGDPIEPGDYTLRATVYAEDGSSTTVEQTIQIQ
ncbi:MAG: SH3 domain-containing protein [Chloroflexi bacterium]|nr:SH3 domain-containing protein [Chloroflexota bacterium]